MRLNGGNVRVDTIDRMNSLIQAIAGKRIKHRDLIA